ncbi:conserved hypothetical membrane-spanning protein [Alkaliphilus metalliredigens QYMF]|uniref:Conserved hypothetical membrane-spanning protein n=1 Tax=Alkaliphilus metalliredigens (strain QYMF) TaxID=293826 RepID=A6TP17_ALKMQ|nr:hypothetical protein [Alkaliphilus metalliredigens]ABR47935.1 conserved hypothetical membrane-spanning protein [Alkaliphilus metalliredigens QYMF]
MRKNNAITISLISIILFSAFFIAILIFYGDIITLNNSHKSFTREYYDWYLDFYWNDHISMLEVITSAVKMTFRLIFTIQFFYLVADEQYQNRIDVKNLAISIILGLISNYLISIYIKYYVEHYRLFMTIISTQIFSLVLLSIVLKLKLSFKMDGNLN